MGFLHVIKSAFVLYAKTAITLKTMSAQGPISFYNAISLRIGTRPKFYFVSCGYLIIRKLDLSSHVNCSQTAERAGTSGQRPDFRSEAPLRTVC